MNPEATVLIVDDEPRLVTSLTRLLKSTGLKVEAYRNAEEFLESFHDLAWGCAVVDVYLEEMNGLDLQEQLISRGITFPIIFISGYPEVCDVVRAMKAGAFDFLEKPFEPEFFLQTVAHALEKHKWDLRERDWRRQVEDRLSTLTPREREILELLVAGRHGKAIALRLGISRKTVDVHRAKVFQKMQIDSSVALAALMHRLRQSGGCWQSGLLPTGQHS